MPQGLPQFTTKTHGEDGTNKRIDYHFTVTMVHGQKTHCYVTPENTYSDPNLMIECLHRTFTDVESRQGKLPDVLYLQFDNCWRENKNCVMLNWCASLMERGLFPGGIEIGFLPKGHTHNECDQCASRLSVGLRHRDVKCRTQLNKLLDECYAEMDVQWVQDVADTTEYLNPGKMASWTHSRYKRIQNIATYRYFRFSKKITSGEAVVVLQTKKQVQDPHWSQPEPVVKRNAPERQPLEKYVNLVKPLSATRIAQLEKALQSCRSRLDDAEWAELMDDFENSKTEKPKPFHWTNHGRYATEDLQSDDEDFGLESDDDILVPPPLGCSNTTHKSAVTGTIRSRRTCVSAVWLQWQYVTYGLP